MRSAICAREAANRHRPLNGAYTLSLRGILSLWGILRWPALPTLHPEPGPHALALPVPEAISQVQHDEP
jgi:hypothetical protein